MNQEIRCIIKNELEYIKFRNPKHSKANCNIYKKYKNIIEKETLFLDKKCSITNRVYCYVNSVTKNKRCVNCNKKVKYLDFSRGYNKFCSISCSKYLSIEYQNKYFKTVHNDKYMYFWNTYVDNSTKMKMKCNDCEHIFWQTPSDHKDKHGCIKCKAKAQKLYQKLTKKQQYFDFIKVHKNKYIYYWDTYIDNSTKMKIKCMICKFIFLQSPAMHKSGQGCSKCRKSKGELKISSFLDKNSIVYYSEYKFSDCKNKRSLPFDFYLPDYNVCIEYDGEGHFQDIFKKDRLKYVQNNDKIKDNYCFNKNIKLIRVPYWEFDNTEKILSKELEGI